MLTYLATRRTTSKPNASLKIVRHHKKGNAKMNTTIEKLAKVRAHDEDVRRKYDLQKRPHQMSFRAWLRRKSALGESAIVRDDIQSSMLATLPINATVDDVNDVASAIGIMNQSGAVVVTAIAVANDN
jgi:HAMP domain-containing protein